MIKKEVHMTNVALWVQLEAKKGKEAEVERFLRDGLTIVNNETETITWYALKLGPTSYAIFDTFSDNKGRELTWQARLQKHLRKRHPIFSLNLQQLKELTCLLPNCLN
jgi:hypothetical protein